MYRQCTTEKTAQQQRIFCNALYQAMQEKPYCNISITDLCAKTELSRNIFYRLFDCKDDILYALIDECFFKITNVTVFDTPQENLIAYYTFWRNQKQFLDILHKNRLESFLSIRAALCCCSIDFGLSLDILGDSEKYTNEILAFYSSAFIGLLLHWYHSDFSRSVEEMTELTYKILIHSTP